MSIVTTFPFTTPANYNAINAQVVGGVGKLGLVDNPGQIFSNTFDDDTGFTYDALNAEFVAGKVQQVDKTPANSVFAALFDTVINANWHKTGVVTAALNGVPSIVSGRLQCFGVQGADFGVTNSGIGTIKFKYKPNYTGAPSTNRNMIMIANAATGNSRVALTHSPSGDNFRLALIDSAGATLISTATIGPSNINLSAATTYEVELAWDNVAGVIRLFLNGALHGTATPGAWAHGTSAARVYIGANATIYNSANASFEDLVFFSNVQHTAGYAAGYTLPAFIYSESKIDGPFFTYTGLGTIVSADDGVVAETGAPRYTVGLQYWDGAAWSVSDGSYAQANSFATLLANLAALVVTGASVVPWSVIFPDTNTLSSVDSFSVEVTGQKYAAEGSLTTNTPFVAREILDFQSDESLLPANTSILYIIWANGIEKYHDGASWVVSDGTSAQANTLAEVQANIDSLLAVNSNVKIKVVMTSSTQNVSPEVDSMSLTYDFGALEPAAPIQCQVFAFVKDIEDLPHEGATITLLVNRGNDEYVEAAERIVLGSKVKTTDANGFFSYNLIISDEFETAATPMQFKLSIKLASAELPVYKNGLTGTVAKEILFTVPNQASVNLTEQIGAV